jgi:hypothetical protein
VHLQLEEPDTVKNTRVEIREISGEKITEVENIRTLSKTSYDKTIVDAILGNTPLDIDEDF